MSLINAARISDVVTRSNEMFNNNPALPNSDLCTARLPSYINPLSSTDISN